MKRCISFLLALIFLTLPGCGSSPSGDEPASRQFFAMDTVMKIDVYGPSGEDAVQAARAELERLDALLSRTREDSQLSRLNAHAGDGSPVTLDPEAAELLDFAKSIAQELPGAFDITIAPVMDAWGFAGDHFQVPSEQELAALLPLVDSGKLTVDAEHSSALLEVPGMAADLGAVAKGFAAARAEQLIRAAGAERALLDLGGNITVLGTNPEGQPWRVAVKDPRDTQRYLGVLSMVDQTSSTSGGYERYFEEDGVRYHHIIDPKTGCPAQSGLLSVTVVSADARLADALSTALFVAGADAALDYWRERGGFELLLCAEDGTVTVTEGLESAFQFRGEENGYTYETARR